VGETFAMSIRDMREVHVREAPDVGVARYVLATDTLSVMWDWFSHSGKGNRGNIIIMR
jgi:hypothetical protein